jgi:hypothetical protein
MSETTTTRPEQKVYPAEVQTILQRGNAGDPTVLPQLRQVFDAHPELVAPLGDLVRHAEQALVALAAGPCLTAREAISRRVHELRTKLNATATNELERLLVDRVCVSWLEVYHADVALAEHQLGLPGAAPATQAAQKRLDAAHRRYLTAVKTLAVVQKLLRPVTSTLELLAGPGTGAGPRRTARPARCASPAEGVPVLN